MKTQTDSERLCRIETRLTRLAEELGADIEVDRDWLTVDDASRTIYLSTLGRSLHVINKTAKKRGAVQKGKSYELVYKGITVGTIVLN